MKKNVKLFMKKIKSIKNNQKNKYLTKKNNKDNRVKNNKIKNKKNLHKLLFNQMTSKEIF